MSVLTPEDLIRLVRRGDTAAAEVLARMFQPLVHKIAKNYYGLECEEKLGSAQEGLAFAIARFNEFSNVPFANYAAKCIRGKILYRIKGRTKADRKLAADPGATDEDLLELYSQTTRARAARARRLVDEARVKREVADSYDTTEPISDDGLKLSPKVYAGAVDIFDQIHLGRARRHGEVVELAARLSDTAVMKELKEVGRRQYANQLCERDRVRHRYVEVKRTRHQASVARMREIAYARAYQHEILQHAQVQREREIDRRLQRESVYRGVADGIRRFLKERKP
jgi:hypothetical protein